MRSILTQNVTFAAALIHIQCGVKNRSKLTEAVVIEVNTDIKCYIYGSKYTHSVWGEEWVKTDGWHYQCAWNT